MGSVYRPTRQVGEKRVKYRCYRIAWQDEHGQRQTEKAFTDKAASEALLRRREQEVERKQAGTEHRVSQDDHLDLGRLWVSGKTRLACQENAPTGVDSLLHLE